MFKKDDFLNFDSSPHSVHTFICNLVMSGSTILDVGCNTGYIGKKLKEKNVVSDGIDINKIALDIAKKNYRELFTRDLYVPRLDLGSSKYDYIIFADILEHLPLPQLLLKDSKKYLKKNGKIIISLPNIARFEIRLKLLFGNFDYAPGILGEDHLRFFTRKTALKLIQSSGLTAEKIIPAGMGHRVKIFPTVFAFQFVFVCMVDKKIRK